MASSNPLLSTLFHTLPRPPRIAELYAQLLAYQYVILVPRVDTLDTSGTDSLVVDEDFVASHIVRLPSSTDLVPIRSDSSSRSTFSAISTLSALSLSPSSSTALATAMISGTTISSRKPDEFYTLNGKTLVIRDGIVKTERGFKKFAKARLVKDSLHYDDDGHRFVLYHIDAPLIVNIVDSIQPDKPPSPAYFKSFRSILEAFPVIATNIDHKLEQMIHSFNDQSMVTTDRSALRRDVESLLQKGYFVLDTVDKQIVFQMLQHCNLTAEMFYQIFESYIMERIYDILFFKLSTLHRRDDVALSNAAYRIRHLDLTQVGLPGAQKSQAKRLMAGVNMFRGLGALRTPTEKIECLLATIGALTGTRDGVGGKGWRDSDSVVSYKSNEDLLSTDALIPLLLLTILRSNVTNLASNLSYMRDFSFERDVTGGEYGYALSTLEGVIHYILGNVKPLSVISRRNRRYWRALKRGDVAFVKKMHRIRSGGSYFEGVGAIDDKGVMEFEEDEEEEEDSEESESTQEMENGQAALGSEGVVVASELHDWDAKPLPPIPEIPEAESKDIPPIVITYDPNLDLEFDEKQGNGLGYLVAHSDSDSDADDELLSRSTPSIAPGTPSSSVLQTRDRIGDTAMIMACRSGNAKLVSFLLEEQGGCSPRDVNYRRETPLMIAALAGHVNVIKNLLEDSYVRETLEQEDAEGNTALLYACQGAGGESNEPSLEGKGDDPPGETARERRALDCLDLLLAAGASLRTRNHSAGANPVLISAAGATPAHRALLKRLAQVASLEVLNARDDAGRTAFHLLDDPHIARMLIDRGADPDRVDDEANRRWTPLHAWASEGRVEMVRFLVGLPDEIVRKARVDSLGRTAVHLACEAGNVDCVRTLLECAEVLRAINEKSEVDGGTALHIATGWWKRRGNTFEDEVQREMGIVGMLVEAGADPDIRNWDGVRAVERAGDEGVKDLLDDCSLFRRSAKASGGRVCAVTRASFDPAEPMKAIEYVVKNGVLPSPTTITTVRRTLDDFRFLRQQLVYEHPESCIPTLDDFLESPWLVSDARVGGAPVPSAAVVAASVRRLDRFLNYLVEHPALSMHELLWEFMLVNEIQRAQIQARSRGKRDLALERMQDEYSSVLEDPAHEEKYFVYARETVMQLEKAVKEMLRRARSLQRCWQDMGAEMKLLTQNMAKHPEFDFPDKIQYVHVLYKFSLAMSNKYPSDIVHVGDMLEDFSFVVKGTVSALQRPQELLVELANTERQILRHNSNLKRAETWHELISTTDRRRKLEEAEEQLALLQLQASGLASRLNYSHQAVSDEMTHFQLCHTEDLRDTLQSYARAQYEAEKGRLRDMMGAMEELGLARRTQK